MARKKEKGRKFRNVHCRTWNMASKLKIMENEKHPLGNRKNDEMTKKREKREIHTLASEISREKLKKVENFGMSAVEHAIWQEN